MLQDQFDAKSDSSVVMKRSWARVQHKGLPEPLYAPRFPTASNAKDDWDAILDHVVELHNEGKLPGFITWGARRAAWQDAASNVFPTLLAIRQANGAALRGAHFFSMERGWC